MRKTFLTRIGNNSRRSRQPSSSSSFFSSSTKRPIELRVALLRWEPHVISDGRTRGVKFVASVQDNNRHDDDETLSSSSVAKFVPSTSSYMFAPADTPDEPQPASVSSYVVDVLHVGDGQVLKNVVVTVTDGKVSAVIPGGDAPDGATRLEGVLELVLEEADAVRAPRAAKV